MDRTGGPSFDLTGKVAMVTGSARGIGFAIASALAAYGADIVLCDLLTDELEESRKAISDLGRRALAVRADITRIPEIQAMVGRAVEEFGRIDILVNNAGINITQWAVDVTEEAWDKVMNINLKAVFFCSQAVAGVMIGRKSGKIINVSSQTGTVAIPQRAAYCSSKGAVNQLTKLLALEWAPHGINVNAIAPTFIETKFTEPMFRNEEFHRYVLDSIPLGRIGRPEDVTGAVVYLASSASDLVTGHVLLIDGGWTIR
jgi:NAD(P)-dependent dehydrogenase (short-subunit alcohol dehydrogenase family)